MSDKSLETNHLFGDVVNDMSKETVPVVPVVPVVPLLEPGDQIGDPLPVLLLADDHSQVTMQDVSSVEVVSHRKQCW